MKQRHIILILSFLFVISLPANFIVGAYIYGIYSNNQRHIKNEWNKLEKIKTLLDQYNEKSLYHLYILCMNSEEENFCYNFISGLLPINEIVEANSRLENNIANSQKMSEEDFNQFCGFSVVFDKESQKYLLYSKYKQHIKVFLKNKI